MWIQSLEDFIKPSLDKREITRAMAVKMLLCGYKYKEIMPILGSSSGLILTVISLSIFDFPKIHEYGVFS